MLTDQYLVVRNLHLEKPTGIFCFFCWDTLFIFLLRYPAVTEFIILYFQTFWLKWLMFLAISKTLQPMMEKCLWTKKNTELHKHAGPGGSTKENGRCGGQGCDKDVRRQCSVLIWRAPGIHSECRGEVATVQSSFSFICCLAMQIETNQCGYADGNKSTVYPHAKSNKSSPQIRNIRLRYNRNRPPGFVPHCATIARQSDITRPKALAWHFRQVRKMNYIQQCMCTLCTQIPSMNCNVLGHQKC